MSNDKKAATYHPAPATGACCQPASLGRMYHATNCPNYIEPKGFIRNPERGLAGETTGEHFFAKVKDDPYAGEDEEVARRKFDAAQLRGEVIMACTIVLSIVIVGSIIMLYGQFKGWWG